MEIILNRILMCNINVFYYVFVKNLSVLQCNGNVHTNSNSLVLC